jgi:DNA polymerase-3 subunit delta
MSASVPKLLEQRLLMLSSGESALRMRMLRTIADAATAVDDFDFQEFLAGESSPGEWISSACTLPFMSERRTVIVRQILKISDLEDDFPNAEAALKSLPPTARLVLVRDEENGDDEKQRRFEALTKKWEKLVVNAGGRIEKFDVSRESLKATIKSELKEREKVMSDKSIDLLIEMTGESLSRAYEEIEKLVLFAGEASTIQESDVRALVVPARDWNVYQLTDAILRGDAKEGMRQLKTLVASSSKPEDAAFSRIFPTISRQLRLVWQARTMLDYKCGVDNIPDRVKEMLPESNNILKSPDWLVRKAMASAKTVTLDKLTSCFKALSDADARMKGLMYSADPNQNLERMVLEMVAAVRA